MALCESPLWEHLIIHVTTWYTTRSKRTFQKTFLGKSSNGSQGRRRLHRKREGHSTHMQHCSYYGERADAKRRTRAAAMSMHCRARLSWVFNVRYPLDAVNDIHSCCTIDAPVRKVHCITRQDPTIQALQWEALLGPYRRGVCKLTPTSCIRLVEAF